MVWCRFGGYGHPSFHLVYHHAHHTPRPPKMGGRYLPPIFVSTRNLPRARQEQRNKSHLRSDASVAFATSVRLFPFAVPCADEGSRLRCDILVSDRGHRPRAAAADARVQIRPGQPPRAPAVDDLFARRARRSGAVIRIGAARSCTGLARARWCWQSMWELGRVHIGRQRAPHHHSTRLRTGLHWLAKAAAPKGMCADCAAGTGR